MRTSQPRTLESSITSSWLALFCSASLTSLTLSLLRFVSHSTPNSFEFGVMLAATSM